MLYKCNSFLIAVNMHVRFYNMPRNVEGVTPSRTSDTEATKSCEILNLNHFTEAKKCISLRLILHEFENWHTTWTSETSPLRSVPILRLDRNGACRSGAKLTRPKFSRKTGQIEKMTRTKTKNGTEKLECRYESKTLAQISVHRKTDDVEERQRKMKNARRNRTSGLTQRLANGMGAILSAVE